MRDLKEKVRLDIKLFENISFKNSVFSLDSLMQKVALHNFLLNENGSVLISHM